MVANHTPGRIHPMVARTFVQLKGASVQDVDLPDKPTWREAGIVTFDDKVSHVAIVTRIHDEMIDPKGKQRELSSCR